MTAFRDPLVLFVFLWVVLYFVLDVADRALGRFMRRLDVLGLRHPLLTMGLLGESSKQQTGDSKLAK
jgi:hypothetical protein